jgi:hypothetical protein
MLILRYGMILWLLSGLVACEDMPDPVLKTGSLTEPKSLAGRICEKASAIATGFGEPKVTGFASGSLDLAIDKVKDHLAIKGAKGFSIEGRKIVCGDYLDFGGAIGRERKCRATALVCGKAG